jgi:uncharacterized protein YegL
LSDGGFQDDKMKALIFYVVIDNSYSMSGPMVDGDTPIGAVNRMLPEIFDHLRIDPMVSDLVHVGVVSFSDSAKTVVPVSDPRNVTALPAIDVEGGTSYKAAFELLYQLINTDVDQLKHDGFRVHRPAVFFVTDGEPTDDASSLQAAWQQLTSPSFKGHPNVIPFGVGAATKELLEPYVTPKMRSFIAPDHVSPPDAIRKVAEILLGSIIQSAQSADAGDTGFVLPEDDDEDWL